MGIGIINIGNLGFNWRVKMISNPKYGWCNFKIRDFEGTPSFLTDVPIELLEAFIDLFNSGRGIAWFDEEGTEFTLVMTPYSIYIIEEKDKVVLHDYSEMTPKKLARELIEDIESNIVGWGAFLTIPEEDENYKSECENHKSKIVELVEMLKVELVD